MLHHFTKASKRLTARSSRQPAVDRTDEERPDAKTDYDTKDALLTTIISKHRKPIDKTQFFMKNVISDTRPINTL